MVSWGIGNRFFGFGIYGSINSHEKKEYSCYYYYQDYEKIFFVIIFTTSVK